MVNREKPVELPTLNWVKSKLRNNVTFRVREKVLAAYVIGSIARGTAKANSDIDIALVIPAKRRVSALRLSERFPFVKRQLSFTPNDDSILALQDWMKATRKLGKISGLKFLPKLQLKFPVGVDAIVKKLTENPADETWRDSVIEIWQNKDGWKRLYAASENED